MATESRNIMNTALNNIECANTAAELEHNGANDSAYQCLSEPCFEDVRDALDRDSGFSNCFWDAFGANGVVGSLNAAEEEIVDLIDRGEDQQLGRYVRHMVLKNLIQQAQPRIAALGSAKYDIEDIETACGI